VFLKAFEETTFLAQLLTGKTDRGSESVRESEREIERIKEAERD
jgi:hypothetical protein